MTSQLEEKPAGRSGQYDFRVASYPGSLGAEEKEPGIYCVHMRVIAPTFHGLWTLSVHVQTSGLYLYKALDAIGTN